MDMSQLIDAYTEGARMLRQAVTGMSREQARARPVPGKWSTLEVACHLADIDALDADRMKRIIAEDRPTLMDCDEMLYAKALAYQERDLEDEVSLIENLRRQMARILRKLPESALTRDSTYRIGEKVEHRTLLQIIEKATRHVRHHVAFILEKRQALGLA
jgi:hypothetical protein